MSERQGLFSKVFGSRGLNGISEMRTFFRTNEQPIFFVSPTAFNLLGIDRWVRGFEYIVYHDSWDGAHPRVFVPSSRPYVEFQSSEEIVNYLLRDPEVQRFIESRCAATGLRPMVAMVFFDAETEQICEELDYNLILPKDELRRHLDSKIVTTKLGEQAGGAVGSQRPGSRRQLREADRPSRAAWPRYRSRGADPVRRLGKDDLLHRI